MGGTSSRTVAMSVPTTLAQVLSDDLGRGPAAYHLSAAKRQQSLHAALVDAAIHRRSGEDHEPIGAASQDAHEGGVVPDVGAVAGAGLLDDARHRRLCRPGSQAQRALEVSADLLAAPAEAHEAAHASEENSVAREAQEVAFGERPLREEQLLAVHTLSSRWERRERSPLQEERLGRVEIDHTEGAGPMLDLHHQEGGVGDLPNPADGQGPEHRLHDVLERCRLADHGHDDLRREAGQDARLHTAAETVG